MIRACIKGDIDSAMEKLGELWNQGYSAVDIVVTIFRVVKTFDEYVLRSSGSHGTDTHGRIPEYTKLEYIKVGNSVAEMFIRLTADRFMQEIGFTHMRVLEGVGTLIQLGGLMARLCKMYVHINSPLPPSSD